MWEEGFACRQQMSQCCREQRQDKIRVQLAANTPLARQHPVLSNSQPADLIDKEAMPTKGQVRQSKCRLLSHSVFSEAKLKLVYKQ